MDEDDMERMREARRRRLIEQQQQLIALRAQGHGAYMEIGDQKQFFEEIKRAPNAVVHFYRSSTMRCQVKERQHIASRGRGAGLGQCERGRQGIIFKAIHRHPTAVPPL